MEGCGGTWRDMEGCLTPGGLPEARFLLELFLLMDTTEEFRVVTRWGGHSRGANGANAATAGNTMVTGAAAGNTMATRATAGNTGVTQAAASGLEYVFDVSVKTMRDRDGNRVSVTYSLGGTGDKCVNITVQTPVDPRMFKLMDPSEAHLNRIDYSSACRVGGVKLDSGAGTRRMLRTAFEFVVRHARERLGVEVKSFKLTDASSVPCLGGSVSLPVLSFLQKGATWYEFHFGAKPKDPWMRLVYDKGAAAFASPEGKPSFTELERTAEADLSGRKNAFDAAPTLKAFFRRLEDAEGKQFCKSVVMQRWTGKVLLRLFDGNDPFGCGIWRVAASDLAEMPEMSVSPALVSRGGGRTGGRRGGPPLGAGNTHGGAAALGGRSR